jgi:hypothetical protein
MVEQRPPEPEAQSRSPRPWTLTVSVVFFAAVLLAGVAVALFGGGSDDPGDGYGEKASPSLPVEQPGAGGAGGDGAGEPLTAAPATEWTTVEGVFTPVSAQFGPVEVDASGVPSGFAHSPEGALFAAAQIALRTGAAFPVSVRQAVTAACVTGDEAEAAAFAETVAKAEPNSAAQAAAVTGFDYLAYTPEEALVELVMDAGVGDVYAAFRITVVWTGTDWALVAPMNGDWNTAVRPVEDPTLFTPWGP